MVQDLQNKRLQDRRRGRLLAVGLLRNINVSVSSIFSLVQVTLAACYCCESCVVFVLTLTSTSRQKFSVHTSVKTSFICSMHVHYKWHYCYWNLKFEFTTVVLQSETVGAPNRTKPQFLHNAALMAEVLLKNRKEEIPKTFVYVQVKKIPGDEVVVDG